MNKYTDIKHISKKIDIAKWWWKTKNGNFLVLWNQDLGQRVECAVLLNRIDDKN